MTTDIKWFEVRDRMTFIVVLAIRIDNSNRGHYLANRAGFRSPVFQVVRFNNGKTAYDPYDWAGRTMHVAHSHIESNWDSLPDGAVIDVEFILNETSEPKKSEQYDG